MDDRRFVLLKRKLEALNYSESLDPASGPLCEKLVDDLVHTTESYRALKIRCSKQTHELEAWNSKMDIIKRDNARLLKENNGLHMELIKENEKLDSQTRDSTLLTKKLEQEIADLTFWKRQNVDRYKTLEQENTDMRKRLDELVAVASRQGKDDPDTVTRMAISKQLGPSDRPGPPTGAAPPQQVDLVKIADARVVALESALRQSQSEIQTLQVRIHDSQEQVRRRDEEVLRLGRLCEAGRDVERLNLEYRNEANENIILSLNQQVDFLTAQLAQAEEKLTDVHLVESSLASAVEAKDQAERQRAEAAAENREIRRELVVIQEKLTGVKTDRSRVHESARDEVSTAMAEVSDLRQELAKASAGAEAAVAEMAKLAEERGVARTTTASTSERVSELEAAVTRLQQDREELQAKADKMEAAARHAFLQMESANAALQGATARVRQLESEHAEHTRALTRAREEASAAEARLREGSATLSQTAGAGAAAEASAAELRAALDRSEAAVRRLTTAKEAAEEEASALRAQVSDLSEARLRSAAAQRSAEEEISRLTRASEAANAALHREASESSGVASARDQLELEAGRLRGQVEVLRRENDVLQQQVDELRVEAARVGEAAGVAIRQKDQFSGLQPKVEQLQRQVQELHEARALSEVEMASLRTDAARAADGDRRAQRERDSLAERLDGITRERDVLTAQLRDFEGQAERIEVQVASLAAEKSRAVEAAQRLEGEANESREAYAQADARMREDSAARQAAQRQVETLERRLAVAKEAADAAEQRLADASDAADSARAAGEEGRGEAARMRQDLSAARAAADDARAELSELREDLATAQGRARAAEEEASSLRRDLAARERDMEQLKSLISQVDVTREELVSKIKQHMANLRVAEHKAVESDGRARAAGEREAAAQAEVAAMRSTLQALDAERDRMQSELDARAEEVARVRDEAGGKAADAESTQRALAAAEARQGRTDAALAEAEAAVGSLRAKLEEREGDLSRARAETGTARDELRAVSGDLANMTREQQVVNAELVHVKEARDSAREELRATSQSLAQTELLVQAKQKELDDLVAAYQALGAENRRMASGLHGMQLETSRAEQTLHGQSEAIRSIEAKAREVESQNRNYVVDLQALERQVDTLSQALADAEKRDERGSAERASLQDQLGAAKALTLELERSREVLQRSLAEAEAGMGLARQRQMDLANELESAQHRVALESNRTTELEALLATTRAEELKAELTVGEAGMRSSVLKERTNLLEEQASTLQRQVTSLQAAREVQERELSRLRSEAGGAGASAAGALADAGAAEIKVATLQSQLGDAHRSLAEQQRAVRSLEKELAEGDVRLRATEAAAREKESAFTRAQVELQALQHREGRLQRELAEAREATSSASAAAASRTGAEAAAAAAEARYVDERARAESAERRVASLQVDLRRAKGDGGEAGLALDRRASEMESLQKENERALALLHKMSAERDGLMAEVATLKGAVRDLEVAQRAGDSAAEAAVGQEAEALKARYEAQLRLSEAKRQQVERDFDELVANMEGGGSRGGGGGGLESAVRELREEKQRLERNVEAAGGVTGEFASEARRRCYV